MRVIAVQIKKKIKANLQKTVQQCCQYKYSNGLHSNKKMYKVR